MSAEGGQTNPAWAAADWWRWWRDGLATALPDAARIGLEAGAAIVTIDLEDDGVVLRRFADGRASEIGRLPKAAFDAPALRAALAAQLARPRLLRDSFVLRLADRLALTRELSLPIAARRNIGSLLEIELERQSPVDRSEIYHDYRITKAGAGRIDVVWRIVRRKSLAQALDICRQAGVDLAAVAFASDETLADGSDFPVDTGASLLLRLRRWIVRGLIALILVLLVAIAAGTYARSQDAAEAFAARVDQLRIAARGSLELEHAIAAAHSREALVLGEKQRPTITRLLAETTRVLPDGSWLTDFAYRDGDVRIQGYSNAASALIALFDASPLFTAAEFRAPLVQARSPGLQQFDLAFKLRPGAR